MAASELSAGEPVFCAGPRPTAALDKATGCQTLDLMRDPATRQNSALLVVIHGTRILDVADRIARMEASPAARHDRPPCLSFAMRRTRLLSSPRELGLAGDEGRFFAVR